MVSADNGAFVITGPTGSCRVAPRGTELALTHVGLSSIGIEDFAPVFAALWALCAPGVVDTITFAWRAGDPYETDTVRQR